MASVCGTSQHILSYLHYNKKTYWHSQCPLHSFTCLLTSTSIQSLKLSTRHLSRSKTALKWNTRQPTKNKCPAKKVSITSGQTTHRYEFTDDAAEVELRISLPRETTLASEDVFLNIQDTSLVIAVEILKEVKVLLSVDRLYGKIKPSETVWYIDENDLVVSLKKRDVDVKWPDLIESWGSLVTGVPALLKGTSVYLVGDSSEINWEIAKELAVGLEYTPLQTSQLLEQLTQNTLDKLVKDEGESSVVEAETAILENINTHVRLVVATIGGNHGAASRPEKWKNLHGGFTIWLSQSQAKDKASAEEEARTEKQNEDQVYAAADVVVKLSGWGADAARPAAEGCLRALKYLIEPDKELPGKKSLYIRMGCRGDWPNLMSPGWNPLSEKDAHLPYQ